MNLRKLSLVTFAVSLLSSASVWSNPEAPKGPLQDTAKAVQYFKDKVDFSTNAHGLNMVVEGHVKDVVIVDVRKEEHFKQGHVPGAINIPYDKHDGFKGPDAEFKGLNKNGYTYVYCYEMSCNLAQLAAIKFASMGYPVKEVEGGFQSWKDHKFKIVK